MFHNIFHTRKIIKLKLIVVISQQYTEHATSTYHIELDSGLGPESGFNMQTLVEVKQLKVLPSDKFRLLWFAVENVFT